MRDKEKRSNPKKIAPTTLVAAKVTAKSITPISAAPKIPISKAPSTAHKQRQEPLREIKGEATNNARRNTTARPKATQRKAAVSITTPVILKKAVITPIITLVTTARLTPLQRFSQLQKDIKTPPTTIYANLICRVIFIINQSFSQTLIRVIILDSFWCKDVNIKKFERLKGHIKTDVLIIGGGMTGILCAERLKNKGVDYVLLEADRICSGVTCNTTAKITVQHSLIYSKIIKEYGKGSAQLYYKANNEALELYKDMCRNIDCDFEEKDSVIFTTNNPKKIAEELTALYKIGVDAEEIGEIPLPVAVSCGIKIKNQAQFNPLKFISHICKDLNIYERSRVSHYENGVYFTENGSVKAKRVIVATHFPFLNKHGAYFLKMYQHRSYNIAIECDADIKGMYVDENMKGMSFRNYKNTLIIGGGSHRTGKKGGGFTELEKFKKLHFPHNKEIYRFATQDCMTLDGIPYIGRYGKHTPNLYVGAGFNKWGMTASMVAATLLSDLVCGKENEYKNLFSPQRSIWHPQLLLNGIETSLNLITPTTPRCPHLGCALKWNSQEHSWDCPCHGSRFSGDGKLLDGPANNGTEIRK